MSDKNQAVAASLEFVCHYTIPAQPRFDVAKKFTKTNREVSLSYFSNDFLLFGHIIEEAVGETVVTIHKLSIKSKLAEMTTELGEKRITTLSQLYWMLSKQPQGEKPNSKNRRLLTNGYTNILRILDKDGIERAVCVCWGAGSGWRVCAYELEFDYQWGAGCQVISGN